SGLIPFALTWIAVVVSSRPKIRRIGYVVVQELFPNPSKGAANRLTFHLHAIAAKDSMEDISRVACAYRCDVSFNTGVVHSVEAVLVCLVGTDHNAIYEPNAYGGRPPVLHHVHFIDAEAISTNVAAKQLLDF